MKYTKLGRTGLTVSRICLGCMSYGDPNRGTHPWTLDEEASRPFIARALERTREAVFTGEIPPDQARSFARDTAIKYLRSD